MKLIGFFLLPSGWIIVIAAIALLRTGTAQPVFVFAGIAVELLGLIFLIRSHRMAHGSGR
jgi:hypothetical protein